MPPILPSSLSVTDTDNTTFPNTSGGSSNIAEDCPPSGINNALRSVAAMLAAMPGWFYNGATRPDNVQPGAHWIDTSGGVTAYVLKYYDGADDISILTINRTANTVSFAGALTGNVTGNLTGNASTATALNATALASAGISDLVGIASQAEAEAGMNNTKAMTPLRTAQAIAEQSPFTESYLSTAQSIAAGGTATLAHGLSARPALVTVELVCTTNEDGFVSGDRIYLGATERDASVGHSCRADATNVYLTVGASGLSAVNPSGTGVALDPTNWDIYVRAWA